MVNGSVTVRSFPVGGCPIVYAFDTTAVPVNPRIATSASIAQQRLQDSREVRLWGIWSIPVFWPWCPRPGKKSPAASKGVAAGRTIMPPGREMLRRAAKIKLDHTEGRGAPRSA